MPPATPRLRILSVGGNAVSAFLSWRLSATQACDVTLVWKTGFDAVYQYGISFKSDTFGNERFKPRHVVRSPEEAASASRASFDYVLLCVKALPDVYDLAAVIESVVAPQHTCILVNTTNTLGVESYLEQRFPTNVVLSLVSGVELTQLGPSEFEHKGSTALFVGAANKNPAIPASIQTDMAEALSMTLKSGQVDCEVSPNIRQQQYERMIGPIAFHTTSVLFETPSHAELLEKEGVRILVTGVIDELITLARAQGCEFKPSFREETMEKMIAPTADANNIMYQDFIARRPLEIETSLGAPMKLALEAGIAVPRIQTVYALLHNANVVNQTRPQHAVDKSVSDARPVPGPRMSSAPVGPANGSRNPYGGPPPPPSARNSMRPSSRAPMPAGPPPAMRGGRPSMNGYPPRMNGNGYHPRGPPPHMARRPSFEGNDFEEFSHLMLYDTAEDGGGYDHMAAASTGDLALRERELALRQKELALREREYHMRRGGGGGGGRMPPPRASAGTAGGFDMDDDEDGEDFFDPMAPALSTIDADNFDVMSVTSRRTRKAPSAGQLRANPEMMSNGSMRPGRQPPPRRPGMMKNRTSAAIMAGMPAIGSLRDELMNNPLMGYSSDRFGTVDRINMGHESRTNSLTAERLHELQQGGGPPGSAYGAPPPGAFPMNRRESGSPGYPMMPSNGRPPPRPSPPNGYGPSLGPGPGPGPNGRPSPPGMRQPVPRPPPGRGPPVAPPQQQQIEQQTGVSNLYPPKSAPQSQVRSLTGSASASAGSGDSNRSAPVDSEPSAHSSSSSLPPRPPIGVR